MSGRWLSLVLSGCIGVLLGCAMVLASLGEWFLFAGVCVGIFGAAHLLRVTR